MSGKSPVRCWQILSESVTGAAHVRAGKPNQDAIEILSSDLATIAVVADGHGSRKSFRSDRGSKLATKAALAVLRDSALEFATRLQDPNRSVQIAAESEFRSTVSVDIPQRIVSDWQHAVSNDLARDPFSERELQDLAASERESVDANNLIAYGTTVVSVLMLQNHALFLQLGDGDILVVGSDGQTVSRPLTPDPRSFANETASLGMSGAASLIRPSDATSGLLSSFRAVLKSTIPNPPSLVLITTDGYPNAFVTDAGFQKAATDLLTFGRDEGWDYVRRELRGWLEDASQNASGDDITVAILHYNSTEPAELTTAVDTRNSETPTNSDLTQGSQVETS